VEIGCEGCFFSFLFYSTVSEAVASVTDGALRGESFDFLKEQGPDVHIFNVAATILD